MRCGSILTMVERRSTKGTRMAINHHKTLTWWATSDVGVFPTAPTMAELSSKPNVEICDGKIIANVSAEDEPYYGGCSSTLSITYVCEKCDNAFFPELPQTAAELSALLTRGVEEMDATVLRSTARDKEITERARVAEQMAKWKADESDRLKQRREKGLAAKSRKF